MNESDCPHHEVELKALRILRKLDEDGVESHGAVAVALVGEYQEPSQLRAARRHCLSS